MMENRSRAMSLGVSKTVLLTATMSLGVSTFLRSFKESEKNLKLTVFQTLRGVSNGGVSKRLQKPETHSLPMSLGVSTFFLLKKEREYLKLPLRLEFILGVNP